MLIDEEWRFTRDDPPNNTVSLLYDERPQAAVRGGAPIPASEGPVVKSWVLPTGNDFIKDVGKRATRPERNLGDGVAYVAPGFDDSPWGKVDLPHDYAIEGPFSTAGGGGMGRLPSGGVVWYRKNLTIPPSSAGNSLFLVEPVSRSDRRRRVELSRRRLVPGCAAVSRLP